MDQQDDAVLHRMHARCHVMTIKATPMRLPDYFHVHEQMRCPFRCMQEMLGSAGCVPDLCAMHENMKEEPLQYLPQLEAFPRSLNSGLVRVYVAIFLKTHFLQPFFLNK